MPWLFLTHLCHSLISSYALVTSYLSNHRVYPDFSQVSALTLAFPSAENALPTVVSVAGLFSFRSQFKCHFLERCCLMLISKYISFRYPLPLFLDCFFYDIYHSSCLLLNYLFTCLSSTSPIAVLHDDQYYAYFLFLQWQSECLTHISHSINIFRMNEPTLSLSMMNRGDKLCTHLTLIQYVN